MHGFIMPLLDKFLLRLFCFCQVIFIHNMITFCRLITVHEFMLQFSIPKNSYSSPFRGLGFTSHQTVAILRRNCKDFMNG